MPRGALNRRQLDASQTAALALKLLPFAAPRVVSANDATRTVSPRSLLDESGMV
jgi:hypothetical protein